MLVHCWPQLQDFKMANLKVVWISQLEWKRFSVDKIIPSFPLDCFIWSEVQIGVCVSSQINSTAGKARIWKKVPNQCRVTLPKWAGVRPKSVWAGELIYECCSSTFMRMKELPIPKMTAMLTFCTCEYPLPVDTKVKRGLAEFHCENVFLMDLYI